MKATVNVLYYKSKTILNGGYPLMICVCKVYQSWNFSKS